MSVEPVFTIRAQDALAFRVVDYYRCVCLAEGLIDQAAQVQRALDEIGAWQAAHPDRVAMPDHEHMPAGSQ